MYATIYVKMHIHECHMHVDMFTCRLVCVYICTCMYDPDMHGCIHGYLHVNVYVYMEIETCGYVYIYACMDI